MRTILMIALLTALLDAAGIAWQTHYDPAFAEAKRDGKILMLFLVQPHCGVCRQMEEEAFSDAGVAERVGRSFVALRLPIRSPELPERYRVGMSPVLTFIDPQEDEIVEQLQGGRSAERLREALGRVAEEADE